jgi:CBS domain-containing protein
LTQPVSETEETAAMPTPGSEMRLCDRPEFRTKPKPLTRPRDATVADAVAAMSEANFGSVVVVDAERRVEGLVTERDVMKRLVNRGRDAAETRLADIMTSNPRIACESDNVLDWLRIMSNERFRRLPVVDAEGRIVAVMTQGDLVSYTWPELACRSRPLGPDDMGRQVNLFLIGGGVMFYSLIMILLLRTV